MLLDGKKLLITGVLMDSSIAFHVARLAQEEGAEVVLTSFGRTMRITSTIAKRLPVTPPVVELDVANEDDLAALAERVKEHVPHLDGVVHSIGFAPQGAFNFMEAGWADVSTAVQISAFSLQALAKASLPLMGAGSSVVGLTFDARYAWPVYDWMGVAKAAFEATSLAEAGAGFQAAVGSILNRDSAGAHAANGVSAVGGKSVPEHLRNKNWVGFTAYTTVLAYNKDVYGKNPPKNWADFFDVEKFPTLTFTSTSLKKVNAKKAILYGKLTFHGITKPIALNVTFFGKVTNPMNNKLTAGFQVSGIVKRSNYALGTKYPNMVISDEVKLAANVEFSPDK